MKQIVICLSLLVGFIFPGKAQVLPADSFYQIGAEWRDVNLFRYQAGSGIISYDTAGFSFIIDKDTTVAGVSYRHISYKALGDFGSSYNQGTTTFYSSTGNNAAYQPLGRLLLQSDSLWFLNDYIEPTSPNAFAFVYPIGTKHFLRKFNLSIGEYADASTVVSSDTILSGAVSLKRYQLQNGGYFLEGIGSVKGLFPDIPGFGYNDVHAVCYRNTSIDYHFNPPFLHTDLRQNCFTFSALNVSHIGKADDFSVSCFPTVLSSNKICYKSNGTMVSSYRVINSIGQCIAAGKCSTTSAGSLQLNLSSGCYRIIFENVNGCHAASLFFVE